MQPISFPIHLTRRGDQPSNKKFRAFIGILMMMGINKLPSLRMYWSRKPFITNIGFRRTTPLSRFERLLKYFYCSSLTGSDKVCKVRLLVNGVLSASKIHYLVFITQGTKS